jgi:MFS family permease
MEPLSTETSQKTIDKFLDKIGYGFHQKFLLLVIILEYLADGAEITILTLCLNCLTIEWNLNLTQRSLLGSTIFIGLMLGALISYLADIYGRKSLLLLGGFLIFFFGIMTSVASSYHSFLLVRFLVGIGIGIIFPVSYTLASEVTPIHNRSNYINNISFSYPLGEILVCLLCYAYLSECNNWRKVVLFAAIPALFSFLLLFMIKESPRFLLSKQRYEEAFEILNQFSKEKGIILSLPEKNNIIRESEDERENCKIEVNYLYLISDEYFNISLKIWILWVCSSFIFYGFIYIFPQILSVINTKSPEKKNIYIELLKANLFMLPVTIVGGILSENKYLGRRYSMFLCYIICGMMTLLTMIDFERIYIWGGLIKFFACCQFSILTTYTSEVYHTKIRTIGSSAANIITRIGGIISPFILEFSLKYFGVIGPLVIIVMISVFSAYLCTSLKVETYKKALDQIYTKENI